MTSPNGSIFRISGHLCGEFTGQRPVTRSFDVFYDLRPNKRLSKQWWVWWFETPSCSLWRHCNEDRIWVHKRHPPDRSTICPLWALLIKLTVYNCIIMLTRQNLPDGLPCDREFHSMKQCCEIWSRYIYIWLSKVSMRECVTFGTPFLIRGSLDQPLIAQRHK